MGLTPKNSCVSETVDPRRSQAIPRSAGPLSPQPFQEPEISPQLLDEYTHLKERYLRTTNALASAAHDLKTPLAILNGYVEVLQSEKLGGLNPRQREVLRDMRSSGRRLEHFIQDFLTYSVLETGELKLHYESGDLNHCLAEVCRLWSPRFQDKGVAVYFLPHDKLAEFSFDSAKVERVISNLLENASKFTPTGGTVWLHAEPYMWERRSINKTAAAGERRRAASRFPIRSSSAWPIQVRAFLPNITLRCSTISSASPDRGSNRRHGPGPGHRPPPGQCHGRQDMGGKRTGRRLQVFFLVPLKPSPARTTKDESK